MRENVRQTQYETGVHTTDTEMCLYLKPTQETYDALQLAYEHFSAALFKSALPNCLITLQRKGRTFGYFHRKRFARRDGAACDEIALNPVHFGSRSIEETLSTLVHEMVHLWQTHFGKPGRGRYHNREWAEKMKSLGLHPSSTGQPGGDELGDTVSHYIIDDGPYARAAADLVARDYRLEWQERTILETQLTPTCSNGSSSARKTGKRVKYTCPLCGLNAWAKSGASLMCGEHQAPMSPKKMTAHC